MGSGGASFLNGMDDSMRAVLALLAIVAVSSCQASPGGRSGAWPPPSGTAAAPARVQSDVAAILKGMEQARVDGLRRAGR